MVAATPSCNMLGNLPGPSGVTQSNRVRCLNTSPGHNNRIEPGVRCAGLSHAHATLISPEMLLRN